MVPRMMHRIRMSGESSDSGLMALADVGASDVLDTPTRYIEHDSISQNL